MQNLLRPLSSSVPGSLVFPCDTGQWPVPESEAQPVFLPLLALVGGISRPIKMICHRRQIHVISCSQKIAQAMLDDLLIGTFSLKQVQECLKCERWHACLLLPLSRSNDTSIQSIQQASPNRRKTDFDHRQVDYLPQKVASTCTSCNQFILP